MLQLQNDSKIDDEKIEESPELKVIKEDKPTVVHVTNKESPSVSHVPHFREKTPVKMIEIPILKPVKNKKVISFTSIFSIHFLFTPKISLL